MDLVKAEIEKQRKKLVTSGLLPGNKKFFKRSLLRQKEEEEYFSKSKRPKEQSNNVEDYNFRTKTEEEDLLLKSSKRESRRKRKRKAYASKRSCPPFEGEKSAHTIIRRSDYDTFQRLKRVQLLEPESKGLRNDLIAALDKLDDAEDESFIHQVVDSSASSTLDVKTKDNTLTVEELEKMKIDLARYVTLKEGTATDDATTAVVSISKLAPDSVCISDFDEGFHDQVIDHTLRYLKFLLSKWEYIKPLLRTLQNNVSHFTYLSIITFISALQNDILNSLVKIMANDAYLELAIGNAPWPLGVTNHGIHSRTAQEKIYAKNVAHVLNDETQRKYIQAIKD
ncbi:Pre-mRNA-splicing factor 18 [Schistosoma japonicum]|uniref:Pre-mRNA-splicing factor 18 n=1 Tax=Schistosoma japonicum TaxID=6182 RepID=A0A4Z2DJM0_SCHJA|nr:Pre-mRNA-splicing factor 18 [Schistosoma japonicum]